MARVVLKDIKKVYDNKVTAIEDVNLVVEDKEFAVLVGPSGCGKSTLLRMIAGLEEISSGTLLIEGKRVNDLSPKERDIAMVFQNYALYPHMTVFDNMAFGLKLSKLPKAEIRSRVEDVAETLGLQDFLKRRPKALSGGQRQRVAIGRAIVRKPKVFLFDEPLSNLDAKLRVQMRTEIKRLHKKLKATMIYVTHDQVEAMTMGTKIVVLKDGAVQQVDTPMDLYDQPVNRFVASFIGSPSMNFLEGKILGTSGKMRFEGFGFKFNIPKSLGGALKAHLNCDVLLGVRPEDIHQSEEEGVKVVGQNTIEIDVVEPIGAETFIYFQREGKEFCMRANSRLKYQAGQQMSVGFTEARLFFFDKKTGKAIT